MSGPCCSTAAKELCIKKFIYWGLQFLIAFAVLFAAAKVVAAPTSVKPSPYDTLYKPSNPVVEVDWENERTRYLPKRPTTSNGLSASIRCSCVLYVEWKTGINKSVGLARNWPITSNNPTVGGIVILNEGPYGHVAYIESLTETTITISETNYSWCRFGTRTLPRSYVNIRGYYP